MKKSSVLIVGAGPTGLAAAAFLKKFGVTARVIDKNPARSTHSKALAVQAGTLEAIEQVLDPAMAEAMRECGRPAREVFYHLDDQTPTRVDLTRIPSKNNFILILSQSDTERFFEENLQKQGISVERQTELVDLRDEGSKVRFQLRKSDGQEENGETDFIIGADGAHSRVRELAGIPYQGGSYTGDFVLGDVKLKWPWGMNSARIFMGSTGVIAAFPLPGEGRYRLIFVQKEIQQPNSGFISPEDFREVCRHMSRGQIEILETDWISRFRVHHRIARNFVQCRLALAGDACHIHSPAGGQGMNTGIMDAMNLADKIRRILRGEKPLEFLRQYEKERKPVAQGVLRGTDFIFRMALLPENLLTSKAREYVLPHLLENHWLQEKAIQRLSQIDVARREIARILE